MRFIEKYKGCILVLLIVGFLVYANSTINEFIWDDEEMVVKNAPFFQIGNIPLLFTQATFYSGGSKLSGWFYRPVVMGSFLITKVIFGPRPFWFHFVQITFHLINGVLLFLIFRYLFKNAKRNLTDLLALSLALIFIVHPANVEAVAYIASVAEPLYTLFILSLFFIILESQDRILSGKKALLPSLLFLLALLTKEGAIIFLPISLIYIYLYQKKNIAYWVKYLGLGFVSYLFIRVSFFGIQTEKPHFLNPIGQATFVERLQTLPYIFFSFIRTFLYPRKLSVSQHEVVKSLDVSNFWIPIIAASVFFAFSIWYLVKTKNKIAIFWFLWFLVSIIPVLNIFIALDMTFAERWLYFPMIGLLGFFGAFIYDLVKRKRKMLAVSVLLIILAAILGARTIARNSNWRDGLTLYAHDIRLEPESYDLHNNLGVELFRQGNTEASLVHFQQSVELQPKWTISNNNLGAAYEAVGDLEKAEEYYKKSIELGDYYLAYENYAQILIKKEKFEEAREFLEQQALRKFPSNKRLLNLYYYLKKGSTTSPQT